ncbi:c-type cytochrome [Comamonas endophytica]|uniref:Cytochrome c n=2 Tax=Comamonas endophytica TaxID=2949090 RepID=A0ABY6GA54_9BURK|nr:MULTISPECIES: c-type cytochrome [unclassified Acidovorax]MCD2512172.1 cytochrome c [Acidovorax sp. D4N7]UYG51944.1 cytochrome c [Acidovorax sp. 5MLIR]
MLLAGLACACAAAQGQDRSTPAPEARILIERGKALLGQYQCGACHTIPEVPISRGPVAQPLDAWSQRSYIAGRIPNTPAMLAQWIMAPQALVPGTAMPDMGVSAEDARAMAAFLFSLE